MNRPSVGMYAMEVCGKYEIYLSVRGIALKQGKVCDSIEQVSELHTEWASAFSDADIDLVLDILHIPTSETEET